MDDLTYLCKTTVENDMEVDPLLLNPYSRVKSLRVNSIQGELIRILNENGDSFCVSQPLLHRIATVGDFQLPFQFPYVWNDYDFHAFCRVL